MERPLYRPQDAELRRAKEAFVSNLQGTTKWEVFCVLGSLPLCLLTAAYIEARVAARVRSSSQITKQQWQVPKLAFEVCGVVVPLLLLLMSGAPAEPAFLMLFLLWGSLALKLWMRLAHGPACRQHMAHMLQHMMAPRKRFVSAFRGGVMLATCLAILGVDFPAFPRRYAKAERYGGGVMDVGVGAIIFAGGLVAAVAAGASAAAAAADPAAAAAAAAAPAGGSSGSGSTAATRRSWSAALKAWLQQLLGGAKAAVPLLLLGGGREIATALVGYQAHLGEYGLHWNFFYTIAGVTLLTLAVPIPPRWLAPLGLGLTATHQLVLSCNISRLLPSAAVSAGARSFRQFLPDLPGLLDDSSVDHSSSSSSTSFTPDASAGGTSTGAGVVTMQAPSLGAWIHMDLGVEARQAAGFWGSYKAGLGSLPGYWALDLLGAAIGHQLGVSCAATAARARAQLSSSGSSSRPGGGAAAVGEAGRLVWAWVGSWWVVDLVLWGLLAAVEAGLEPVSRRTCNLPYVLWTCAQCLAWLLLVVMADLLTAVICSSTGGCGTTPITTTTLHTTPPTTAAAAAAPHGSARSAAARRSLEATAGAAAAAAAAAAHHQPGESAHAAAVQSGHGCGPSVQHSPQASRAGSSLARRSLSKQRSAPMAAAAAAAAALTAAGAAAAVTGSGIAGGSMAAVAAAAAAVSNAATAPSSSSREASPRGPRGGGYQQSSPRSGGGGGGGSPKGYVEHSSSNSSSSGSGGSGAVGGGTAGSASVRSRKPSSRLHQHQHHHQQQQHQQQQQQHQVQPQGHTVPVAQHDPVAGSSSGGPMRLMLAFNRNMLALFLLANLLTGAVNLSINTLAVGSWAARGIVGGYMLLLCGLAVLLDKRGITLKPW